MNKLIQNYGLILGVLVVGSFLVGGITAARTILGMVFFVFAPFYLVLLTFNLTQNEKFAFALFCGIVLYPSFVYWLGFVIPFSLAIFAVSLGISLVGIGLIAKREPKLLTFWKN